MAKDYTILACGDVSLAKTNPEEKFELVQPLLQSVDFRIGQMEEILSDNCNVQVYAYPKPRGAKGGDPALCGSGVVRVKAQYVRCILYVSSP